LVRRYVPGSDKALISSTPEWAALKKHFKEDIEPTHLRNLMNDPQGLTLVHFSHQPEPSLKSMK
jgi:hypothetical protein